MGGPYSLIIGVPVLCCSSKRRDMNQPVRQRILVAITWIPIFDSQSSPKEMSGMDKKLRVPSSKALSSVVISCHGTLTETALIVPPENQGRFSRAIAERLTIKHPSPVGYPNSLYQLTIKNSGWIVDKSIVAVGKNAAASSSTSNPFS